MTVTAEKLKAESLEDKNNNSSKYKLIKKSYRRKVYYKVLNKKKLFWINM